MSIGRASERFMLSKVANIIPTHQTPLSFNSTLNSSTSPILIDPVLISNTLPYACLTHWIDFVTNKHLEISWVPRHCFCEHCKNLEFMNLIAIRDTKLTISQIDETRKLEIMKFKNWGATEWTTGNLLTC